MKSLVLALSLIATTVLSSAPKAFAAPGAVDRTAVIAGVQGRLAGIESAYLLADGRLQVKRENGPVSTVWLSKEATASLAGLAASVSDANVDDQTYQAVCRMMPPESLGDLSVSGYDVATSTFNSKRRLILTNQDCTVSRKVFPTDEHVRARALELRSSLQILALDALKVPAPKQEDPIPGGPVRAH